MGGKGKLTNTKIDTMQNYFGIALRSNVGNFAAMKSTCLASIYICDYHNNCPKSLDTRCQYQKEKQGNTSYYKSKGDLPIDVRRAILPIYQSHCKSECSRNAFMAKPKMLTNPSTGWCCLIPLLTVIMMKKLRYILRNSLGLIQVIIWQSVVDLSICVVHVHPFIGCRNHRKSVGRCCVDINVETEGNSYEMGAFEIRY